MRFVFVLCHSCFPLALPARAQVPTDHVPQTQSVEPDNGKIGSVLRDCRRLPRQEKID